MSVGSAENSPVEAGTEPSTTDETERDEGVPDEIWNQLQADKRAAEANEIVTDALIHNAEQIVSDATDSEH